MTPRVSVVVPTRRRPDRLSLLLAGLARQTLPADLCEVIVADDGHGDGAAALVAPTRGEPGPAITVVHNDGPHGPGPARNAGWRVAQAPLIVFVDDDCVPEPEWLERLLARADADPGSIVQGRTLPAGDRTPGVLDHTVVVERLGPQYQTCNIAYPRELLEQLGGFDERFGSYAGEDTDLAWRAIESGRSTVFAPDALVRHAVESRGVIGSLRATGRWTGTMRVLAEHPGARAMLERGVFWNVWHYLLLRSLLALAAPAWLRRIVLAWHVRELHRRARRHGAGVWAVPFLLVHDTAELIAVVRGAVRYRTLVL